MRHIEKRGAEGKQADEGVKAPNAGDEGEAVDEASILLISFIGS
jgi:hypothetical protein